MHSERKLSESLSGTHTVGCPHQSQHQLFQFIVLFKFHLKFQILLHCLDQPYSILTSCVLSKETAPFSCGRVYSNICGCIPFSVTASGDLIQNKAVEVIIFSAASSRGCCLVTHAYVRHSTI